MMKILTPLLVFFTLPGFPQPASFIKDNKMVNGSSGIITGPGNSFIENAGQYGQTMAGFPQMGDIKYGFEGLDMPVLFTPRGLIHLHRKVSKISDREERRLERQGLPEDMIEKKRNVTGKTITMEWVGCNPKTEIMAEEMAPDYHTYGVLQKKAWGYRKITYKDLYPGIDVVYHLRDTGKAGFEYSIIVRPGADMSLVKMKYGGDVKKVVINKDGSLGIHSGINEVTESMPVSFVHASNNRQLSPGSGQQQEIISSSFRNQDGIISFITGSYDPSKTLVIDPFVSNTVNLTGANNGIAKDIDFDYDGNIYVAGGGDGTACKLAKFDASGARLWTFNGTLTTPSWTFGTNYGGWVVEKNSGNVFIGQGANITIGTRVIRLSTAGLYDNYISAADANFRENWKMLWSCNSGSPKILIAGGGIVSNINFAICDPSSVNLTSSNITGITSFAQDIADIVIDPASNDMYTIFTSVLLTPFVDNRIYKNAPPYTPASIAWSAPSGYFTLREAQNRPYLSTFGNLTDNAVNSLAVNGAYLFYWDGLNLKAFNKSTGAAVGTPLVLSPNVLLMQGGIFADECNNVFIGSSNGTIKVLKFNGSSFDDAGAADITVPGFPTAAVYDLAYDQGRGLLYACGNGFVGSFDISSYCASTTYTLSVSTNCPTLSATATLSPAPPVGSVVTYTLFSGTTQIATNNTGVFTPLVPGTNYTIRIQIDQACGGLQLSENFTFSTCVFSVTATFVNPSCNLPNGSITATASSGLPPYQYSIDGINFQPAGVFTGLGSGVYTITVKDATGSVSTVIVTLVNAPPPQVSAASVAANCGINDGSITATGSGGTPPLSYSIDGINFQASNIFVSLAPANYVVQVKDVNGCLASFPVTVALNNTLTLNAGNNIRICQGSKKTLNAASNGTSFTWSPATGLSNPSILNPDASPAATTIYTLTAVNGTCKGTSSVTVFVDPFPLLFAGNDTTIAINQPLQLFAKDVNNTGFSNYNWSPSYGLNNPLIANPLAILDRDIDYTVTAQNAAGCTGTDNIRVKVFKGPEIYVPKAFTPNGDGRNDVLKAIPVGIKEFKYFMIFNSYGQRLFSTSDPATGWDGNYNGGMQGTDTYVWVAEGIDYRGKTLKRKGTVVLIR